MNKLRNALLAAGTLVACGFIAGSCKDSSGNGAGSPGQAGSTGGGNAGTTGNGGSTAGSGGSAGSAGSGGSGGGSGGMAGATPGFMAIAPCLNESDYVSNTSTINFGMINGAYTYAPKCLKVTFPRGVLGTAGAPGTNVTFSGDFGAHPLMPSTNRGDQTGNPITPTSAVPDGGTSKTFYFSTFYTAFFAYFCQAHDPNDTGNLMSGVVWTVAE